MSAKRRSKRRKASIKRQQKANRIKKAARRRALLFRDFSGVLRDPAVDEFLAFLRDTSAILGLDFSDREGRMIELFLNDNGWLDQVGAFDEDTFEYILANDRADQVEEAARRRALLMRDFSGILQMKGRW